MTDYLLALAATVAVEALVLAAITRPPRRRRVVTASLFVNLLTHPLAWALNGGGLAFFAIVESGVVVAEALLYAAVVPAPRGRALLWSLAANLPTIALSWLL